MLSMWSHLHTAKVSSEDVQNRTGDLMHAKHALYLEISGIEPETTYILSMHAKHVLSQMSYIIKN
jgi:hypothetical protein